MIAKHKTSGRLKHFYLHEDEKPFIAQQVAEQDIRQMLRVTSAGITRRQRKSVA